MGCAANKPSKDTQCICQQKGKIEVQNVFSLQLNIQKTVQTKRESSIINQASVPVSDNNIVHKNDFINIQSDKSSIDHQNESDNYSSLKPMRKQYIRNIKDGPEKSVLNHIKDELLMKECSYKCFESVADSDLNVKARLSSDSLSCFSEVQSISKNTGSKRYNDASLDVSHLSKCNSQFGSLSSIDDKQSQNCNEISNKKVNNVRISSSNNLKPVIEQPRLNLSHVKDVSSPSSFIRVKKSSRVLCQANKSGYFTNRNATSNLVMKQIKCFIPKATLGASRLSKFSVFNNHSIDSYNEMSVQELTPKKDPIDLDNFITSSVIKKKNIIDKFFQNQEDAKRHESNECSKSVRLSHKKFVFPTNLDSFEIENTSSIMTRKVKKSQFGLEKNLPAKKFSIVKPSEGSISKQLGLDTSKCSDVMKKTISQSPISPKITLQKFTRKNSSKQSLTTLFPQNNFAKEISPKKASLNDMLIDENTAAPLLQAKENKSFRISVNK